MVFCLVIVFGFHCPTAIDRNISFQDMRNNQIVRRVNRFVKPYPKFRVRFPLLVVEQYKVFYHCCACETVLEVTALAFREGRFIFRAAGRQGWLELSRHCRFVDSRGEILLGVFSQEKNDYVGISGF